MTMMESCPLDSGSSVMKSTLIVSQGELGIGSGCSSPVGCCFRALVQRHKLHVEMYLPAYLDIVATSNSRRLAPGFSIFRGVLLSWNHGNIANKSGVSRVTFWLSSIPVLWSALRLNALDLPIVFLGRWCRIKSNLANNKDHLACLWFNFLATMKYSRFLWSIDFELMLCSFQKVSPLFQGSDDG